MATDARPGAHATLDTLRRLEDAAARGWRVRIECDRATSPGTWACDVTPPGAGYIGGAMGATLAVAASGALALWRDHPAAGAIDRQVARSGREIEESARTIARLHALEER